MSEPIHYVISEKDFDLSLLPKSGRSIGSEGFRKHVAKYFRNQYEGQDGDTTIEFRDGNIYVSWMPRIAYEEPLDAIIALLNAGDYAKATPMLETLLQANPRDYNALYNLGLVYSDQGKLDKAQELLKRATEIHPDHANTWVGLGVAAFRGKNLEDARKAFEKALELDPSNAYAKRSYGALLAKMGDVDKAIDTLKDAMGLLPDDPVILLNLGQLLFNQDPARNADEADHLLARVLDIAPHGAHADQAKSVRRDIANYQFRKSNTMDLRLDAVMYCLGALERFDAMEPSQLAPVILEMATLGQSGLSVNDPNKVYNLKLTPGDFTGLHIACMMHVGLKKMDPKMESGMDLEKEYKAALELFKRKQDAKVNK